MPVTGIQLPVYQILCILGNIVNTQETVKYGERQIEKAADHVTEKVRCNIPDDAAFQVFVKNIIDLEDVQHCIQHDRKR